MIDTSKVKPSTKRANEKLSTNHIFDEIAEVTKKRIEYLNNNYISKVPEEVISAWNQILK